MITEPQSKRAAAVAAAILLVRKHGYEKFRLSDVAKYIGVSHAALYNYFPSKEDLLDSINEQWIHEIDESIKAIVESDVDAKTKLKLWALTLYTMKRQKVLSDLEPFETLIASSYKERPFIVKHLELQDTLVTSMVKQAITEGVFKDELTSIVMALRSALMPFHHPVIILQNAKNNREEEIGYLLEVLFAGWSPNR
jgi:AcrR family transcriptional regulator